MIYSRYSILTPRFFYHSHLHTQTMKKVIIASQNPTKIEATRFGFELILPKESFEFEGVDVPSGVSEQPMTDDETYQGASQRAINAKEKQPEANFWVGIEGGVMPRYGHLEAFAWVVILSKTESGFARTASFLLPPPIATLVKQGMELGHADDQFFGRTDSKKKNGAVGILTKNQINRAEYYTQAVILALIPFLNSEIYFN